ncbi:ABC transporter ATP-binding protein [Salipaludibacillus neizhouensis]|uniref:ABC transporter ATP-binding protein n=1 Tax=Salipaludibacillus neizhouensis TaxID=885475 RepID=A0A3A9K165_9BACI|nr:ABC transporter ATP-binding protein [Salipaludibacillus neizhouensis]RKL64988.1 ABC transporter ATP-binding protein [Salipaludibacillus neizhouensis]
MELIETRSLSKRFGQHIAVDGVNLSIKEGVCTALLGPNGAGKTTTLNLLTGLITPSTGTIEFDQSYQGDRRQYIGYLPQYPKFYEWMTGEEFVIFAGELAGLTSKQAKQRTKEMLDLVGLNDNSKKKIAGYSGGMKQRLGIAQALVHEPKLVILDEPVSALDPLGRKEVLEMMKRLKEHTSILFSTHVLHDAEQVSDDIFIMKDGKVVIEGSLTHLQNTYQKPTFFIEAEDKLEGWVETIKGQDWIDQYSLDGKNLTLTVDNVEEARKRILKDPMFQELEIYKFEVAKTSLEDLFMKVTES